MAACSGQHVSFVHSLYTHPGSQLPHTPFSLRPSKQEPGKNWNFLLTAEKQSKSFFFIVMKVCENCVSFSSSLSQWPSSVTVQKTLRTALNADAF